MDLEEIQEKIGGNFIVNSNAINNMKINKIYDTLSFYCDESCHFQNKENIMALVAVYCSKIRVKTINREINKIKRKYGYSSVELKWTKVKNSNLNMYKDIISYIATNPYIKIRLVNVFDKGTLELSKYNLSYSEWYHTIYYTLIKHPTAFLLEHINFRKLSIHIDVKDTHSRIELNKLTKFLSYRLNVSEITTTASNSSDYNLIQIADIIAGASTYKLRNLSSSKNKLELLEHIENEFKINLTIETKFNIFKFSILNWRPSII